MRPPFMLRSPLRAALLSSVRPALLAGLALAGGATVNGMAAGRAAAQATAADVVVSESTLTATLSQTFAADSNYNLEDDSPGTTYYGDTRIGIDLIQTTDTQTLNFSLDTGLRALDQPDESFEWIAASPSTARFAYDQAFSNATFDLALDASSRRIDSSALLDTVNGLPVLPDDVIIVNNNTFEQRYDLDTGFAYGTDAPSTIGFRLSASNIDYSGDTPEEFTPRTAAQGSAYWQLRVNPVLSTVATAGYRYEDADDTVGTQINVAEFDLGLVYDPNEDLSLTFGLGYADREQTQTLEGIETTETDRGIVARALGSYETEELNYTFSARYTTAAPSPRFSGDFRVSYQALRSQITGRVFQEYGLGSEGDDRRLTGAGVTYDYEVNEVSGIAFDVSYANSASADDDNADPDRRQLDFTAQYSRAFTDVVAGSVGYRMTQFQEDPTDAISHEVFLRVGRSFVTGF